MLEVKMHLCSKIEKDRHYIQLGGRGRSRGAEGQGGEGGGGQTFPLLPTQDRNSVEISV